MGCTAPRSRTPEAHTTAQPSAAPCINQAQQQHRGQDLDLSQRLTSAQDSKLHCCSRASAMTATVVIDLVTPHRLLAPIDAGTSFDESAPRIGGQGCAEQSARGVGAGDSVISSRRETCLWSCRPRRRGHVPGTKLEDGLWSAGVPAPAGRPRSDAELMNAAPAPE